MASRTKAMARWGLRLSLLLLTLLAMAPLLVRAQFSLTPIYVGGDSIIDLWTKSASGCPCSFNASKTECACCVPSGGCSCGAAVPNRCTQCGLEDYCANMCNITLDSRELFSKSNRGSGQIKSPQLEGPSICTYRFVPDTGQRVEIQVLRMISIGEHNGTACKGGWLEFEGGARICGRDSRHEQPIVFFSDKPEPVLHMQINENTTRSQFYLYFSFASIASTSVGWPAKGGQRFNDTECDWIYEEKNCWDGCVLASPGYPGLYPPNSRCRFLIKANSTATISIFFTAVLMPPKHCTTDYIAVYAGPTTSSALLKTLCENQTGSVFHVGKDLLVEFRSGPEVNPFNYTGFIAKLNFVKMTTETPTTTTTESTSKMPEMIRSPSSVNVVYSSNFGINTNNNQQTQQQRNGNGINRQQQQQLQHHHQQSHKPGKEGFTFVGCDVVVSGERHRMGLHSTRGRASSQTNPVSTCRLALLGRDYDTVHVVISNHSLSMGSCKSQIEVFDGLLNDRSSTIAKPIGKICNSTSESQHQKQTSTSKFIEKRYSSSSRNMTIILTRATEEDFMDVSFYFHNERESGTQQPKTICDVEYYGLSSPTTGTVVHPKMNGLNSVAENIKCQQHFIPAANQAVIITLNSTMNQTHDSHCTTRCGDQGCLCASHESLDNIDHLLLVSRTHGNTLACLCGNNRDWLPVKFWSTTPVYIEWSSHAADLNLTAEYKFTTDSFCGNRNAEKPEGEVSSSANFSFALNHYYQQKCTYIIDSPANHELVIQIESSQSRPCSAWNLTVHGYNKTSKNPEGPRLHTFCPRDTVRNFTIAPDTRSVIVKLQALGRTVPQYVLRWRSNPSTSNSRNKNSLVPSIDMAMARASTEASTGVLVLLVFVAVATTTTTTT